MRPAIAAIALLLAGVSPAPAQAPYTPGPLNISMPADWAQRFLNYSSIDNVERRIIRRFYVNPEALFAATPGAPLPNGTMIVMADHRARTGPDGALLRDIRGRLIPEPAPFLLSVQEKREGWGEGYPADIRNGNWEYARFNPDLTRQAGMDTAASMRACFTCHLGARAQQDFAFDFWDYTQSRPR
ncbi:cytochrome P460 family protein [Rhodovarius lipocyclicus]|uniref:cytochrome P460 family protein n=1 Tax=Rhodovarius lipocyclicus TaxID=268410 RepID=UPI001359F74A|nr:cytochrome P460 family protein [Rhodovarius lipocyclicus]